MTPQIKERIEQIRRGKVPEGYKKTKVGIIPAEWETTRFKNKFSRLMRKNAEGNTNVLTISAQYGLVNQEEFFNKSVASDDKTNYFLLYQGEYAYNKSYSNGYPFGAIKKLDKYEKGTMLMYPVSSNTGKFANKRLFSIFRIPSERISFKASALAWGSGFSSIADKTSLLFSPNRPCEKKHEQFLNTL